jgi:hypothetical protein
MQISLKKLILTSTIPLLFSCSMFEYQPWLFAGQTWEGKGCVDGKDDGLLIKMKVDKVAGNKAYVTFFRTYKGKQHIIKGEGFQDGYKIEFIETKLIKNNTTLLDYSPYSQIATYMPMSKSLVYKQSTDAYTCEPRLYLQQP